MPLDTHQTDPAAFNFRSYCFYGKPYLIAAQKRYTVSLNRLLSKYRLTPRFLDVLVTRIEIKLNSLYAAALPPACFPFSPLPLLFRQLLPRTPSPPFPSKSSSSSSLHLLHSQFSTRLPSSTMTPSTYREHSSNHQNHGHLEKHMIKLLKQRPKRPSDSNTSFASEIDDIISGPSKPKRSRSKAKHDKNSVICEKCGAPFSSVGNLNRHRRVSHEGKRVYCTFEGCKQSFSQTADLTRHRKRVHRQEK